METVTAIESGTRGRALALIAGAELLAMTLWFGVSAVAPQIVAQWRLTAGQTAWLTLSVQLGFVAGTLVSALLNLPDVLSPRKLMAASALCGAIANALLAAFAGGVTSVMVLRFVTGICLAGVYPPGMKLIATWFREGRGVALGVLIGALTLGKAAPYLINAVGSSNWRVNVGVASLFAAIAASLVGIFVSEGPYALASQPFDVTQVTKVFANRGVRLANLGYFGHMWELYAVWTWAPAMMRASLSARGQPAAMGEIASFVLIGSGAIGCVLAGVVADRLGRAVVAAAAMAVSGACCFTAGLLFGGPPAALIALAAVWGVSVVADSAQFSAAVTELGDPRYLGTALTIQTCIGFLITTVSIRLVPLLIERAGWSWAFAMLGIGPLLGIVAMWRLRGMTRTGSSAATAG
jgi:MFS family permease